MGIYDRRYILEMTKSDTRPRPTTMPSLQTPSLANRYHRSARRGPADPAGPNLKFTGLTQNLGQL
jgi:hypothetical protein